MTIKYAGKGSDHRVRDNETGIELIDKYSAASVSNYLHGGSDGEFEHKVYVLLDAGGWLFGIPFEIEFYVRMFELPPVPSADSGSRHGPSRIKFQIDGNEFSEALMGVSGCASEKMPLIRAYLVDLYCGFFPRNNHPLVEFCQNLNPNRMKYVEKFGVVQPV